MSCYQLRLSSLPLLAATPHTDSAHCFGSLTRLDDCQRTLINDPISFV